MSHPQSYKCILTHTFKLNIFNIIFKSVCPSYNNSLKISLQQDLFISYPEQCVLQVQLTSSFIDIMYDYETPRYAVLSVIRLSPVYYFIPFFSAPILQHLTFFCHYSEVQNFTAMFNQVNADKNYDYIEVKVMEIVTRQPLLFEVKSMSNCFPSFLI